MTTKTTPAQSKVLQTLESWAKPGPDGSYQTLNRHTSTGRTYSVGLRLVARGLAAVSRYNQHDIVSVNSPLAAE